MVPHLKREKTEENREETFFGSIEASAKTNDFGRKL